MQKQKHKAKYIPGIYNYCDRWCERCRLTARCIQYDPLLEDVSTVGRDINSKEFWERMNEAFEAAIQMLQDMAREHGVDINSVDNSGADDVGAIDRRINEVRNDAIAAESEEYARMVDDWFDKAEDTLYQRGQEMIRAQALELPGANPMADAEAMKDCIEVVRWYQHQIHVKIVRALLDTGKGDAEGAGRHDANGSAKVALIGMDRSIGAWSRLREHFPGQADDVLSLLVQLDRLRRATERRFSDARSFERPGFDTGEKDVEGAGRR